MLVRPHSCALRPRCSGSNIPSDHFLPRARSPSQSSEPYSAAAAAPQALTGAVEDLRDRGEAFGREGLQGLVDTGKVLGVGQDALQVLPGVVSSPYSKGQVSSEPELMFWKTIHVRKKGVGEL